MNAVQGVAEFGSAPGTGNPGGRTQWHTRRGPLPPDWTVMSVGACHLSPSVASCYYRSGNGECRASSADIPCCHRDDGHRIESRLDRFLAGRQTGDASHA